MCIEADALSKNIGFDLKLTVNGHKIMEKNITGRGSRFVDILTVHTMRECVLVCVRAYVCLCVCVCVRVPRTCW